MTDEESGPEDDKIVDQKKGTDNGQPIIPKFSLKETTKDDERFTPQNPNSTSENLSRGEVL